jgi:endoglucanase
LSRRRLTLLVSACLSTAAVALAGSPAALAGVANAGIAAAPRSNPIAGLPWGHYTGLYDGLYSTYLGLRGYKRGLVAQIALRPTVHWFGAWEPLSDAFGAAQRYVKEVTHGNPRVLTQMAVFRFDPWEDAACSTVPGPGRQASYRAWISRFAAGIGSARTALILQPDLAFTACSPGRSAWMAMAAYAARRFNALPHTTVYIDAGAYQWLSVNSAAAMLQAAGIRHARGFALNTTEYDSTSNELSYGAQIVSKLASMGMPGKHFVINTAENGSPFLNGQYPGDPANPRVCRSAHDRLCVTLGIPPTTDVANPAWHLGPHARSLAARFADAYLWVGRPWLAEGAGDFQLGRTLGLVASAPFLKSLP